MKLFTMALTLVAVVLVSGCAIVKSPVAGGIYTDAKSGLTTNTTANLGSKSGEACAMSVLGLVGLGDAGITAAARNGGIKQITHVDEHAMSILGIYGQFCTRVYGN